MDQLGFLFDSRPPPSRPAHAHATPYLLEASLRCVCQAVPLPIRTDPSDP